MPRNLENQSSSNGDTGSNNARNLWHRAFDLTRCRSRQKPSQTSTQESRANPDHTETQENEPATRDQATSNRNRLEWFVSAKVTEELIGKYKDKNDLGLGFDKYLGWSATNTKLEGIKGEKLRVYEKERTYYITNEGNEQKYKKHKEIKIAEMSNDLLENIERGFVDVE